MARTAGSHSEVTGPRVRAAALTLFADQGFAAASMRQLAAIVGVQAGALYRYAPDKQSLLFDLIRSHREALVAAWAAASVPDAPPVAALETFVRFHIRFELDRPEAVRLCLLELRNLTGPQLATVEALRAGYDGQLEAILRQGQADKLFTFADPKIATRALMAMISGIGQWYSDDGKLPRERVERIFWNLARKSVGA